VLHIFLFIQNNRFYDVFLNLSLVLRIYLLLALTNCSDKISFPALKIVKNYLKSITISNRLNALQLFNIKNNMLQNINV